MYLYHVVSERMVVFDKLKGMRNVIICDSIHIEDKDEESKKTSDARSHYHYVVGIYGANQAGVRGVVAACLWREVLRSSGCRYCLESDINPKYYIHCAKCGRDGAVKCVETSQDFVELIEALATHRLSEPYGLFRIHQGLRSDQKIVDGYPFMYESESNDSGATENDDTTEDEDVY